MVQINQTLQIKSVTIKNRIGMPPMCQYSAIDGLANDWHFVHYGTRAVGGAGLIILEATAVAPEGRITPFDLGLWNDEQMVGLQILSELIHEHGAVAGIQIGHAGRKASHDSPANGGKQLSANDSGWITVAPSAIPFDPAEIAPKELDKQEIAKIVSQFKDTAQRVRHAGFKVLELHGAHGYLIHQFLSPLTNHRTDEYGGSFENRIRFLLEIVTAVKTVWPTDFPLFVRISATDWAEGGWNPDETVRLATILRENGIDLIDCSSGGNIHGVKIPVAPGYQILFSEIIRKTGIMTAAVGLITTAEQVQNILNKEQADIVLLGRELLRNPYFPLLSTVKTSNEIDWPTQYLRAK
jgi:NADH:flavin oxidoreductases, Old Yellow Enzyme family